MKKTYISPSIDIYAMHLSSMIAASVNSISSSEADSGDRNSPVNFGRSDDFDED